MSRPMTMTATTSRKTRRRLKSTVALAAIAAQLTFQVEPGWY